MRSLAKLSRAWMVALSTISAAHAATCPFDTGGSDALNDGTVLTRYALGITGPQMIANTRYASLDPVQVKANIECVGCALDMNGDGQIDTVDTTIIARHLTGFTGASLTAGLALGNAPSASRADTNAVVSFLASGCAITGGVNAYVQGGNIFGTAAILGNTDAFPLTVKTGGNTVKVVVASGHGLGVYPGISAALLNPPNVINGLAGNLFSGAAGATIAGGGASTTDCDDVDTLQTTGLKRTCVNIVTGDHSTIGGGRSNRANIRGTVAGGVSNYASGIEATVGGGGRNSAYGSFAVVAGGDTNKATGSQAMVLGGVANLASGTGGFASGTFAKSRADGMFVWSDSNLVDFDPANLGERGATITNGAPLANSFYVRATGGVKFVTGINPTTGAFTQSCEIPAAGTGWNCSSDRNVKHMIMAISPKDILSRLMTVPVSTWAFIGHTRKQLGPMSQDFYRAFGLGDSDRHINSVDAQGVAFAAIQGIAQLVNEKDATIARQENDLATLKREMAAIKKRLGM